MGERKTKTCKTRKCGRPVEKLGVCNTCYSVVYRAIQRGDLTWDEAFERGLVGPRKRHPSPMRDLIKDVK